MPPAAPAGYIGDPGVDHKVIGSPYNTNFIRIERLDPATGSVISQVGFSDLFSIQGRYATNAGVDIDQADLQRGPGRHRHGRGVRDQRARPGHRGRRQLGLGFRGTRLRGQNGHYYGRFPVTGSMPAGATIEVVNASDRPITRKSRTLVDVVRVTEATYDSDAHTLTVAATSSDQHGSGPDLTVVGYGRLDDQPFTAVCAPPPTVTVTSSGGGSATVLLTGTGAVVPARRSGGRRLGGQPGDPRPGRTPRRHRFDR